MKKSCCIGFCKARTRGEIKAAQQTGELKTLPEQLGTGLTYKMGTEAGEGRKDVTPGGSASNSPSFYYEGTPLGMGRAQGARNCVWGREIERHRNLFGLTRPRGGKWRGHSGEGRAEPGWYTGTGPEGVDEGERQHEKGHYQRGKAVDRGSFPVEKVKEKKSPSRLSEA